MEKTLDAGRLSEELISSKEEVMELKQKVLGLLRDKDELQTEVAKLEEELLNQAKEARMGTSGELERPVRRSVSAGGAIGQKKDGYSLVQLMQEGLKRKLL